MEGARADTTDFGYKMGKKKRGAEEAAPNLRMLSPEQIVREIKRMEAEMFKRARNLEFEEAARLRDAIEKMKQQELGLDDPNLLAGLSRPWSPICGGPTSCDCFAPQERGRHDPDRQSLSNIGRRLLQNSKIAIERTSLRAGAGAPGARTDRRSPRGRWRTSCT